MTLMDSSPLMSPIIPLVLNNNISTTTSNLFHSIPSQKLTTTIDPQTKSLVMVLEMKIVSLTSPPQPLSLQCPPSISIKETSLPYLLTMVTQKDIQIWEDEIIEKESYCHEISEEVSMEKMPILHHSKDISAEIFCWQQRNKCSSGSFGVMTFDIIYIEETLTITYTISNTDDIFTSQNVIILFPSSPLMDEQNCCWIPHLNGALSDWTLEWIINDPSFNIVSVGQNTINNDNCSQSKMTSILTKSLPSSIGMTASTLYGDGIMIEGTTAKVFCPPSLEKGFSSLSEWFTKSHNFLEWYLKLNENHSTTFPIPLNLVVLPHSYTGSTFQCTDESFLPCIPGTLPSKGKANKYSYISRTHGLLPSGAGLLLLPSTVCNDKNLIDDEIPNRRSLSILMASQYFGHSISEASILPEDLWLLIGIKEYLSRQILKPFHGISEAKLIFKTEMERLIQLEQNDSLLGTIGLVDVRLSSPSSPSSLPSSLLSIPTGRKSIPSIGEFISNPLYKEWFYLKSYLVLQIMENRLEEKDMRRIISCIYDEVVREGKVLTTALFLSISKSVSDRDMRSFAEQWIFSGGSPHIECSFIYLRKRSVLQMSLKQMVPHFGKRLSGTFLIRVHEMDGVFDHQVHIDDHEHNFELPIHAKSKKIKRKRRLLMNLDGTPYGDPSVLQPMDEEEEEPKYTNPISWIRLDPDQQWIADLSLVAPEEMWCEQLKHDRDIIAQYEAVQQLHRMIIRNNFLLLPSNTALQTHPSSLFDNVSMESGAVELNSIEHILDSLDRVVLDPRIYHLIRNMAAEALISIAPPRNPEATKEVGALRVVNLYNRQYALPVIGPPSVVPVPRPNDWSSPPQGHSQMEFISLASSYYLLTLILPSAMSKVCCRSGNGNVLELMGQVLLNQLRYNDNSSNLQSSDSAYISRLMEAICSHLEGRALVGGMSMDRITKEFVRELDRHLLLERLPSSMSHRNVVMVAVIDSWTRLWMLFNGELATSTLQISVSSRFFGQLLQANGVSMGASLRGKMLESILMQKDSFIDCRLAALSSLLSMLLSSPSEVVLEGELIVRWFSPLLKEDHRRRVRIGALKMLLSHPLLLKYNELFSLPEIKEWMYSFLKEELLKGDECIIHLILLLTERFFPSDESDCGNVSWRERKNIVDVIEEFDGSGSGTGGIGGGEGGQESLFNSQTVIPKLRLTLKTEQPDWAMEAAAESGLSLDYVAHVSDQQHQQQHHQQHHQHDSSIISEEIAIEKKAPSIKLRLNLSQPQTQQKLEPPSDEQLKMEKCIQNIWINPESHPFRYKVDTRLIPIYDTIIKEPMDLQKIKEKLLQREYSSFLPLLKDCSLIFTNCLTFNENSSPIALQCKRLRLCALDSFMSNREYISETLIKEYLDDEASPPPTPTASSLEDHELKKLFLIKTTKAAAASAAALLPKEGRKKKILKAASVNSKLPPPIPSSFLEGLTTDKERLLSLLDYIQSSHPYSHWFITKLDPIALGIPTYIEIINEPMDFSSLREIIITRGGEGEGEGEDIMEFLRLFELIFSNCILFNPSNTVVHQNALVIRDDFVHLAQDLFNISSRKDGHKIVFSSCLGIE